MKKIYTTLLSLFVPMLLSAQGWPQNYEGVMLQAFYWDSFDQTNWRYLEQQADELSGFFKLVWLPQSGNCGGQSMGYDDLYWFPGHYDSSFGTETDLRSLISTFNSKGIGTIADVVINHRKTVSGSWGFPSETYKGVTYTMGQADVVSNDGGTGKADTGENWDGMPDLDHNSTNVQNTVKAYLNMLLKDFGYVGFRYDMVKGYKGSFTKIYNEDSKPTYSVGECWDGTNTIKNWIDATSKTSAAFDFQFRYTVRNAANGGDWRKLVQQNDGNWPLVSDNYNNGVYKQYAVTFVENHDTEKRSNAVQDPIKKDTLAANAYLLAMPGTPCIFLTHWRDCKQSIKAMIDVRRFAGIHNMSTYNIVQANNTKYAAFSSEGTKSKLLVIVGDTKMYTPADTWVKVLEGYHFAYYLDKGANTAWVDLASGEYEGTQKATLTAVTNNSGAQLVYTTDGSTPTANSTKVASGTKIDVTGNMTLKVGLLIGSTVSGIVTRTYTEPAPVDKKTIDIYVNTDKVSWTAVNFWSWGGDDSHSPVNKNWPGDKVTATTTIGGKQWYSKQFTINGNDDYVNLVFSTGSGTPQTVDINNVTTTKFFEISDQKDGSKHLVNDVTGSYTDIREIKAQMAEGRSSIYDLQGRRVSNMQRGIYIVNGKKVVIK